MRFLAYLALALVAAAAYFIWRGRQERLKEAEERERLAKAGAGPEVTRACAKCGAYVPVSGAQRCDKPGCPVELTLPRSRS
jgi:hypothetical protein